MGNGASPTKRSRSRRPIRIQCWIVALLREVSEQLGHASTAFTLDTYAHVLPHMQDEAAARRAQVNCRLDVPTAVVVLHLLICNGGKDGIHDHGQGPSHHPETYP
jgi:hypothetical protein